MILKPIQIVLDEAGNQIDLNYRPIRSNTTYRHLIQIVAPNLATEACDVTVSTYGKEIIGETIRTRLAIDSNGTYLKGADVVATDQSYYNIINNYNVWEVELIGTVSTILQKLNTTKIAIVVTFSEPVVDSRALNYVGKFGTAGDLPVITDEVIGDYRQCDRLTYYSSRTQTEYLYHDIAIYDGSTWILGEVFRLKLTAPIIQLSVDPALMLLYDHIEEDISTLLIEDVARLDGIISNTQTNVNNVINDHANINHNISDLEQTDVLHDGRLVSLEADNILHDGILVSLEANDRLQDDRLDDHEAAIELNTAKISFDSTSSSKLAGIEAGATADQTASEIKSAYESNANTNAYTDAEKSKLSSLESSKFLGTYINLTALQSAYPSPAEGSYAHVDSGVGADVNVYIWDNSDNEYVTQIGTGTSETAASIKTKYESNADTNAFTDAEKNKLSGIEAGAQANDASTTLEGNIFNGNSQLVKTTADGKLPALDASNLTGLPSGVDTHNNLGGIQGGATGDYQHLTTAEVSKLTGIEAGAQVNDANTTLEGNTFNGNSQLVKTTADGKLPALDASNLTGLPSGVDTHNNLGGIQGGATGDYQHLTTAEKASYDTAVGWGDHGTEGYLKSETNTSLSLTANTLTYTDETGTPTNIDLSIYLDDTNLARIISGTYNSELQTLVFTRDDDSTFSIDASMFLDDTNLVTSVNGSTGAVTLDSDDIAEGSVNLYADANATNQGNTFNGNSQLVKTTADGKLPVIDGSNLTNLPSGASSLDDLTDVVITTPSDNQFIRHNGTNFVNETVTILALANYTTSLPTTGWAGSSAPYSYAATVSGILSTDVPHVDLDLSSSDYGDIEDIETSYSKVYRAVSSADTITFYASAVPEIAVPLKIKVVR